ncbi:MAG TPA: LuxR C-terminal-related transcriptional regulator, partial [Anaerolineales bacterium]|nr:LuxR C-terminal-related transcriptional regulator [Anaerolineales bacterium]
MPDLNLLSERELEILHLLAEGKSNKDIAESLFISTNTVKVHLRNIFSKLEVSSRTEAVLLVLRGKDAPTERVLNPETTLEPDALVQPDVSLEETPSQQAPTIETDIPQASSVKPKNPWFVSSRLWLIFLGVLGIAGFIMTGIALARLFQPDPTPTPGIVQEVSSTAERWLAKKELPSPITGLAATIYEDKIYVIGGEDKEVLSTFYRYDPEIDVWETLASKPTAVADIQAVVAGGEIYVPGGRLASGQPTNILEIYNPRQDNWMAGA